MFSSLGALEETFESGTTVSRVGDFQPKPKPGSRAKKASKVSDKKVRNKDFPEQDAENQREVHNDKNANTREEIARDFTETKTEELLTQKERSKNIVRTSLQSFLDRKENVERNPYCTSNFGLEENSKDFEQTISRPRTDIQQNSENVVTDATSVNSCEPPEWENDGIADAQNLTHQMRREAIRNITSEIHDDARTATETNNFVLDECVNLSASTQVENLTERISGASNCTTSGNRSRDWKNRRRLDSENRLTEIKGTRPNKRKASCYLAPGFQDARENANCYVSCQEDTNLNRRDFDTSLQNQGLKSLGNNCVGRAVRRDSQEEGLKRITEQSQTQQEEGSQKRRKLKDNQSERIVHTGTSYETCGSEDPMRDEETGFLCTKWRGGDDSLNKCLEIQEYGSADTENVSKAKRFSHSTRRKQRRVEKHLLEFPAVDRHMRELKNKTSSRLFERREKLTMKEATATKKSVMPEITSNMEDEEQINYLENEEGTMLAPQVQVVNGQIVINEGSLVVSNSDGIKTFRRVEETGSKLNCNSYINRTKAKRWSKVDTELFYKAMQQFGTNFEMIQRVFPGRTRNQVKAKFKIEERRHPFKLSDKLWHQSRDISHYQMVMDQLKVSSLPSEVNHEMSSSLNLDGFAIQDTNERHETETLANQLDHRLERADLGMEQTGKQQVNFPVSSTIEDNPCSTVIGFSDTRDSTFGKGASLIQDVDQDEGDKEPPKSLFSYQMVSSKPSKPLFSYQIS